MHSRYLLVHMEAQITHNPLKEYDLELLFTFKTLKQITLYSFLFFFFFIIHFVLYSIHSAEQYQAMAGIAPKITPL